jgi:hypothetical protein
MIEAAEAVADFVSHRNDTDLDTDRMLLFALVRAIEVFGEAAAKVSPETRAATARIPWTENRGDAKSAYTRVFRGQPGDPLEDSNRGNPRASGGTSRTGRRLTRLAVNVLRYRVTCHLHRFSPISSNH